MKVLDAEEVHTGLKRNIEMLQRLEGEMQGIEKLIKELTQMEESLKGQGGEALRSFYAECHLPFLQFFMTFKASFTDILEQIGSALSSLEPDPSGFIEQDYLQVEVEQGINRARDTTVELTNETNAIMDDVSDIVSLPKLDDSEVIVGIVNSKKHRNQTVTDLLEFDQTQTNALNTVQSDLLHMKHWLNNIKAMMKKGVTDVHFPAEQWKGYVLQHPLQLILGYRNSPLSTIKEIGLIGHPGSVYQTLPYTFSDNLPIEYPLFQPSKDSVNVVPTSANMNVEEGLSCPRPDQEKNNLSESEIQVYIDQAVEKIEVIDEYASEGNDISGTYFTLSDGRILRKYYGKTNIEYEFVQFIPNERIGGAKALDSMFEGTPVEPFTFIARPTKIIEKGAIKAGKEIIERFDDAKKVAKDLWADVEDGVNNLAGKKLALETNGDKKADSYIHYESNNNEGSPDKKDNHESKETERKKTEESSVLAPGGGLATHEARGGHLIKRHVDKTDEELLNRLKKDRKISAASTFKDRATAEKVVQSVLTNDKNIKKIEKWINNPDSDNKLALKYKGDEIIGRGINRKRGTFEDYTNARIVLKKEQDGSFVLTGYPEK